MRRLSEEQLAVGREHLEEVTRLVRGLAAVGFSVAEMAAEVGVSPSVVQRIRGARRLVSSAEEEERVREAAARLLRRSPAADGGATRRRRAAQRARWEPLTVDTLERPARGREPVGGALSRVRWMDEAVCASVGGEAWFDDVRSDEAERAVRICCGCPVADQCLAAALRMEGGLPAAHRFGVWGGLTPAQRARLPRPGRAVAA